MSEISHASVEVYSVIRKMILDLDIPPDTRVNIGLLSRQLDLSTTPIREAMMRLEGDGLLLRVGNKGFSTPPLLSLNDLEQLFEYRMLVEPWAAKRAAESRLSNPGTRLKIELDELTPFLQQVDSQEPKETSLTLVNHDMRFHDMILAASGNEMVRMSFNKMHFHFHCFRLFPQHQGKSNTLTEHQDIQEAIQEGHGEAAFRAMETHLTNAFQRFSQIF